MRPHASRVLAVLAMVAVLVPASGPAQAAAGTGPERPSKIVLVSMPSINWEDVTGGYMPNLSELAEDWSIAALSLRTVGPRTDLASAYASISAGNRARAHGGRPALEGDGDTAPNAIAQVDGGARVRGMSYLIADNFDLGYRGQAGLLGERLGRLGLRTGVAGNADGGFIFSTAAERKGTGLERRRFAALALANLRGEVDVAEIGDFLTMEDPETVNGYRANLPEMAESAARVIEQSDVAVIELTDTYRESRVLHAWMRRVPLPKGRAPQIQAAAARDDALLGEVLGMVDLEQDTVLVLATEGPGPFQQEILTVAVMAGVGAEPHGWLTSATTLRPGLVSIADVGPGILRLLGEEQPKAMIGQALYAQPGPAEGRAEHVLRTVDAASFHADWVGRFFVIFVYLQLILYGLAWFWLRRHPGASLPWIRRFTLGFMCAPAATLIMAGLDPHRWGWAGPMLVVLAVSTLLTAAALRGPWRRYPAGPATFVCAVNLLLIAGDLLTGATLQLSSLIGYSPVVAGRFYGLGNLTFAILATSSLLVAGQVGARFGRWGFRAAVAIAVVTIVLDGGSSFGADFGGVLALIPAFGVLLVLLSGRRLSVGRFVALGVLAGVVAILVGLLDALRPPELQTHIGRFVERLLEEGPGGVQDVVFRKINANWSLLTRSALSASVPAAIFFLVLMLRRPYGRLRTALETIPGLRTGLVAAIVGNVLGFAVNDSGIAIPAMGLAIMAPYCLATVLGLPSGPDRSSRGEGLDSEGRPAPAAEPGNGESVPADSAARSAEPGEGSG